LWLKSLGSEVLGYSLPPDPIHNHYRLLNLDIDEIIDDVRNSSKLKETLLNFRPDIVFHLAAQPLVKVAYQNPQETFETNVLGTVYLYEAVREIPSVKALINVTTDKVYHNQEWSWGYRETDTLGGKDPYSASKSCVEMISESYRHTFFKDRILLATARAGNVIGGGDWSPYRLIPDLILSAMKGETISLRNPHSYRPWQHVLDPLSGYLYLGFMLLEGHKHAASCWNFGPSLEKNYTVEALATKMKQLWPSITFNIDNHNDQVIEAKNLGLDSSKASHHLGYKNIWNFENTIQHTMNWYRAYYENREIISLLQLDQYLENAKAQEVSWIK
jgi:CDP-glucose 4,6-dehydratase